MANDTPDEATKLRERIEELERSNAELQESIERLTAIAGPERASPFIRINWELHKWAGLIAVLFLLVMAVSGIFLTHANILGLQPFMLRLHTGMVLGPFARFYCDVVGVSLILFVVTGIVLYCYPGGVKRRAAP
ncbi:MAG: hypothetical protein PVH68_13590 [Armatimonadota bacterium]|jgi:hypothetical protein